MSAAHTPGPWLREGNTIYSLMHAGWRKGEELFKNRFHAYVQADRECPDAEHEANVRLIAAAPDLLEALQAIVALDDGDTPDLWHYQDEFNAGRAAIVKAGSAT